MLRRTEVTTISRPTWQGPLWSISAFARYLEVDSDPDPDPGPDPDPEDAVIDEAEKQKQAEFDKERQRADQEAANAKKAREQAAWAAQQLQTAQAEAEAMKQRLAEMEAKAADKGIEIPDLNIDDYEGADRPLVQAINGLKQTIQAKDGRIESLEKAKDQLIADNEAELAHKARMQSYNDLLSDLDDEHGAEHRNAAIKAFNDLRDSGDVPKDAVKATRILERCYKEAAKAASKGKTKTKDTSVVSLDSGSGGGGIPGLQGTKLKEGSLEEVSAQIEASLNTS